jgi:hypothetical protein
VVEPWKEAHADMSVLTRYEARSSPAATSFLAFSTPLGKPDN